MSTYSDWLKQPKSKNIIHNGNFDSWQRGTGPFTSAAYTADRWSFGSTATGGGVFAVNASTSQPNYNSQYTYKITATTGQASFTGAEYVHFLQKIEGYDFQLIANKTVTFSFWVYATVAGTYSCFFRSSTNDYSLIKEFEIYQAATWEYKHVTFYWDASVGTYTYLTSLAAYVGFAPACGTTYATSTIGEWVSGNYIASSNQTNFGATTNNVFLVSQVQLEVGASATSFDFLSPEDQKEVIFRYYQAGSVSHLTGVGISTGNGTFYGNAVYFTKRTTPSIAISGAQIWSPQNGWRNATSTASTSAGAYRVLFIATDTGVANYVHSQGLLFLCNFAISCDL